jgi:hypothetical protein
MNALLILLLIVSAEGVSENHLLASLVTTNRPGHYLLPTTWQGRSQLTIATGFLRFDTNRFNNVFYSVNCMSYVPDILGYYESSDRTISNSSVQEFNETVPRRLRNSVAANPGYAYRKFLPSENELIRCETLSQLKEKLGEFHPSPGGLVTFSPDGTQYRIARGWSLFALGTRNTIEIIEVDSYLEQEKGAKEAFVRYLRVIRYTLKPAEAPTGVSPQLERR